MNNVRTSAVKRTTWNRANSRLSNDSPFYCTDIAIAFGKLSTRIVFHPEIHQKAFAIEFCQHDVLLCTFGIRKTLLFVADCCLMCGSRNLP